MSWVVEPIGPGDADEVASVHVRVWQQAYAGLMPHDYLATLDPVAFADRWRERLGSPVEGVRSWLVRDEDGIVGIATSGPARDPEAPADWQLYAINVLARGHGTGIAQALVTEAIGDRAAYLWVVEGNERAIAFYRKLGFELDGVRDELPETETPEVRMSRNDPVRRAGALHRLG